MVIGGFLGIKLLAPGNPLHMLLFYAICGVLGLGLSKLGEN